MTQPPRSHHRPSLLPLSRSLDAFCCRTDSVWPGVATLCTPTHCQIANYDKGRAALSHLTEKLQPSYRFKRFRSVLQPVKYWSCALPLARSRKRKYLQAPIILRSELQPRPSTLFISYDNTNKGCIPATSTYFRRVFYRSMTGSSSEQLRRGHHHDDCLSKSDPHTSKLRTTTRAMYLMALSNLIAS